MFAKREVETSLRERTLLVALAIQVFVAGFSSFLVVGLASLVDPSALPGSTTITVAVVDDDTTLRDFLRANDIAVLDPPNNETAYYEFHAGRVDAILINKGSRAWNATKPIELELVLPDGNLRTTFTVAKLKDVLTLYEDQVRAARGDRLERQPFLLNESTKPTGGGGFEFVYTLLVPLLVFLPVVLSGALVADAFTEEVQRGTLGILLSTPATLTEIVGGKLLGNAILAPLLAGVWLGLLAVNGIAISGAWAILLLASAGAIVMGGLACLVGLLTGDRHKAHLIYAMVLFLIAGGLSFLPQSPVNLMARFAAGAADATSYTLLVALVAATLVFMAGLHLLLRTKGLALMGALAEASDPKKAEEKAPVVGADPSGE